MLGGVRDGRLLVDAAALAAVFQAWVVRYEEARPRGQFGVACERYRQSTPAPDLPAPGMQDYFAGAGSRGTAALLAITQAPAFLTMVLT